MTSQVRLCCYTLADRLLPPRGLPQHGFLPLPLGCQHVSQCSAASESVRCRDSPHGDRPKVSGMSPRARYVPLSSNALAPSPPRCMIHTEAWCVAHELKCSGRLQHAPPLWAQCWGECAPRNLLPFILAKRPGLLLHHPGTLSILSNVGVTNVVVCHVAWQRVAGHSHPQLLPPLTG